ncbi:hypothetical protein FOA43_001333 [Brettanomyces nanus]|uniref:ZW10 C-terminal helical domain-containing protein n=1 Tax=Eeniella nana TaxID=13502 RepID=A0A875RY23_EENNA|nr:uncharacterized protein FOA43_001333 [Brettanomyces nanus]QPG74016.1 hypothetical protein FOA43_001333 [Brettanomyces nanus]
MEIDLDPSEFDLRANYLAASIKSYISSYDKSILSRELKVQLHLHSTEDKNENGLKDSVSMKQIRYKEEDYVKQLDICNELWYFCRLMNELQPLHTIGGDPSKDDWRQVNFEECVQSFVKLQLRLSDIAESLNLKDQYVKIFDVLGVKLQEYEEKILELVRLYLKDYFEFGKDLSFKFHEIAENLTFQQFLKSCFDYTNSVDTDLGRLFNFNRMFNDWTTAVLKKFDEGFTFEILVTKESVGAEIVVCKSNFESYIHSIERLIEFFNAFMKNNNSRTNYNALRNVKAVAGKNILKVLKAKMFSEENIYPLIVDRVADSKANAPIRGKLDKISKLLSQEGWAKDGICDLEFWMDDLGSTWVNDLVGKTMDELKNITLSIRFDGEKSMFKSEKLVIEEVELPKKKSGQKRASQEKTDDWNNAWGGDNEDDDAWEDEINLDLSEKTELQTNAAGNDDDGWDAWNDDDDNWGGDGSSKNVISKTSSGHQSLTYKRTTMTDGILKIIDDYYLHLTELQRQAHDINNSSLEDIVTQFRSGRKKLIICYFMIVSAEIDRFYPSAILFYNDLNKIIQYTSVKYQVDLSSCFKLSYEIVSLLTTDLSSSPCQVIQMYSGIFFEDGFDDLTLRVRKVPEFLAKMRLEFDKLQTIALSQMELNQKLVTSVYLTILSKVYDGISTKLLKRKEIGSDECDVIGDLIDKIVEMTTISSSVVTPMISKMQSYNKLEQTKLVVVSSLKTILQDFCDAKFFELETSEMTNLIKALFVESEKRQEVIDQIVTIRSAQ